MLDITFCAPEIHPESCHSACRAMRGLPYTEANAARREPARATGNHLSGGGMAAPAKA